MNHFTVIARDLQQTVDFYRLFGLVPGQRPDLGFAGAWLYAEGVPQAVLHVYGDRAVPEPPAGVIDHMAFSARGLRDVKGRLEAAGVAFELRRQRGAGTWQLFCRDPNGAKVELDFDPAEQD